MARFVNAPSSTTYACVYDPRTPPPPSCWERCRARTRDGCRSGGPDYLSINLPWLACLLVLAVAHAVVLTVRSADWDCQTRYGGGLWLILFHALQVGMLLLRVAITLLVRASCCLSYQNRDRVEFWSSATHYALFLGGTASLWVSPQRVLTLPVTQRFWWRSFFVRDADDCDVVSREVRLLTDVLTRVETGATWVLLSLLVLTLLWRGVWRPCRERLCGASVEVAVSARRRSRFYWLVQCVTGVDVWDQWSHWHQWWVDWRYPRLPLYDPSAALIWGSGHSDLSGGSLVGVSSDPPPLNDISRCR